MTVEVAALRSSVTVGAWVSMLLVIEVAASLALPARSVKVAPATPMLVDPVKLADGVKVAVNKLPEPAKFESVPLVAVMSATVNEPEVAASLRLKVMVRVWPPMIMPIGIAISRLAAVKSTLKLLLVELTVLPAMSIRRTVTAPPAGTAA